MPTISVIIPVYNSEKTIRETIESVLNQTFTDFELIIINDGSQDSSLEIISSIQDTRLKVFSYPNAGVSASRNRGIAQASGEFIAFLDSDDLWTADKLESQLQALQANPHAAVAYSWTDYIDRTGKFVCPGNHVTADGDVYEQLLLQNFLENGSTPLIRKEALIKVGDFDESLFGPEDWDIYLRLAANYQFVAVPKVQVLYRISANSVSSNVFRQASECLKVIERAFNQAPASLQHLKKVSISNLYQYLVFKTIEGYPNRQQGVAAAKCLWLAIVNDPALLKKRSRLISIVFIKILAIILLPQSPDFFDKVKAVYRKS